MHLLYVSNIQYEENDKLPTLISFMITYSFKFIHDVTYYSRTIGQFKALNSPHQIG